MPGAGAEDEATSAVAVSQGSVASAEYDWKSVVVMGGGFVTGLAFSPVEAGILYARTDIGGAYRYDQEQESWIPLTDFVSHENSNYLGIESFAADPVKADRLYMAVGTYTQGWADLGAFLRSDDRGETWKTFPATIKMGGNELSRSNGERLAVDPKKPNLLYFGSRRNGLWKSDNEAETWNQVASFPASDDPKGLGLAIVLFDPTSGKKGEATPDIYVGSQVDGQFYRSKDAGATWSALPEQPGSKTLLPRRAVFDQEGTLYLTYAVGDSPYALRDGAVYKFTPKDDKWTDITPLKPSAKDTFGYGGIAVDASSPGTLVTTTIDRWTEGAEIFRTRDGGKTWQPVLGTAILGDGGAKHVYHHREKLGAPQWLGDIKVDPFNPNRSMIVEGGGVWATKDLTVADEKKPIHWDFHSKNIEETVARDMVSPTKGAPLVSVQLDTCGFRHDELDTSPQRGTFNNPKCASADDIDFAGKRPDFMVRVGRHPWSGEKGPRGATSSDGGASWKQFSAEPEGSDGSGATAVSADGAVILWAPRSAHPALSRDGGKTWVRIKGLPAPQKTPDWAPWFLRLASDRVNPKKFYALDTLVGMLYASDDGGATFTQVNDELRAIPEYELQYGSVEAVTGREGDVWVTTKEQIAHSTDSGRSFTMLDGVEEAHGVGFGKAAPGAEYPALYLSGKVGGVTGFFRSTDGGDSFLRINDDAHQFGGATVITGDPRVFGRVYIAPHGRGILYGEPKAK